MKKYIALLFLISTSAINANAQFLKKLKEKVNETVKEQMSDTPPVEKERAPVNEQGCSKEDITKAMEKYNKDYLDAELTRCYKWHVNKSKEDVLKLFNGFSFKKGFKENVSVYIGPKFYGREPHGVQDRYNANYYNGIAAKVLGNYMPFCNAAVFYQFWQDTAKKHIVPLAWNNPAGYIPASFLGTQQSTQQEYYDRMKAECYDPEANSMKNIYQLYFLPYEDFYIAKAKIIQLGKTEVDDYTMYNLADAEYYDYYYGQNGKTGLKFNEDVFKKNADSWAIDSLEKLIEIFSYSNNFNIYAARVIESKSNIHTIVETILKYPSVSYNKSLVENKLLNLCKDLYDISLVKAIPNFTQLKLIESKAFELAKQNKTIEDYETYMMIYTSGANYNTVKKLRDDELARIENDRLARLAKDGPGGIWYLKGPRVSKWLWATDYTWDIVYLDKSTSQITCQYMPRIMSIGQIKVNNDLGPEDRPAYFRMTNKWFYKYNNIQNAAKALYKLKQNVNVIPTEGLLEAYDETPIPTREEKDAGYYKLVKSDGANIIVNLEKTSYSFSPINIVSSDLFGSNVDKENYSMTLTDKNNNIIFHTNDSYKDNGFGAPNIEDYQLPAKISVIYRANNKTQSFNVQILKNGTYNINIK